MPKTVSLLDKRKYLYLFANTHIITVPIIVAFFDVIAEMDYRDDTSWCAQHPIDASQLPIWYKRYITYVWFSIYNRRSVYMYLILCAMMSNKKAWWWYGVSTQDHQEHPHAVGHIAQPVIMTQNKGGCHLTRCARGQRAAHPIAPSQTYEPRSPNTIDAAQVYIYLDHIGFWLFDLVGSRESRMSARIECVES